MIKYNSQKKHIDIEIIYHANWPNFQSNSLTLKITSKVESSYLRVHVFSKFELGVLLCSFSTDSVTKWRYLDFLKKLDASHMIEGRLGNRTSDLNKKNMDQFADENILEFWKTILTSFNANDVLEAIRETGLHELLPEK